MLYTKIKISDASYPKKFYREVGVFGDPCLTVLGAAFCRCIGGEFEHFYLFEKGRNEYVAPSWVEDNFYNDDRRKNINNYKLSDLGKNFKYEYDTGESYCFKCSVYAKQIDLDVDEEYPPLLVILSGKGIGIFENNHYMFDMYLTGQLDPNFSEEDEDLEEGFYMPYNIMADRIGSVDDEYIPDDPEIYAEDLYPYLDVYEYSEIEEESDDYIQIKEMIKSGKFNLDSLYEMIEMDIAKKIFVNDKLNSLFLELIKNTTMKDAYYKVVETYIHVLEDNDTELDDEEIDEIFLDEVKKLVK